MALGRGVEWGRRMAIALANKFRKAAEECKDWMARKLRERDIAQLHPRGNTEKLGWEDCTVLVLELD